MRHLLFRPAFAALLCAILVLGAIDASAALIPIAQGRVVDVRASASIAALSDLDEDGASAPDFGAFVAQVAATASVGGAGLPLVTAEGRGEQDSSIGSTGVSVQGAASLDLTVPGGGSGSALGGSLFAFDFEVDTASFYSLSGTVDTQAIATGGAEMPEFLSGVAFLDVTNGVTLFQTSTNDAAFSMTGSIAPGIYQLVVQAIASSSAGAVDGTLTVFGESSFDLDLSLTEVPEPMTGGLLALGLAGMALVRRPRR